MNEQRRKALAEVAIKLKGLLSDVEAIRDAEEEAFHNLPEKLQNGAEGKAMRDDLYAFVGVCISIFEAKDTLEKMANA